LLAASKLATGDGARLTIVTVVALERPIRRVTRLPMPTGVWHDILIDRARADLERADRLLNMPAERTGAVRFSNPSARGRRRGIRVRRDPAANPAVWAAREAGPSLTAHAAYSAVPRCRSCAHLNGRPCRPQTRSHGMRAGHWRRGLDARLLEASCHRSCLDRRCFRRRSSFLSLTGRTAELSLLGSQLAGWRRGVVVKGCGRGRRETVGSARGR
jgi:hypothetical protein